MAAAQSEQRVRRSLDRLPIWQILMVATLIFLLPLVVQSPYYQSVLIIIALQSTAVTGLTLLMGYTGQISLAQAAFYGIGAYGSGLLQTKLGLPGWLSLPAAVLIACAIAVVVGLPTLRLKENFLALATLGFGVIAHLILNEWKELTGGPSGLLGIESIRIGGFAFDSELRVYYLAWGVALLALLLARNLVQSRVGRALRAVQGSEVAAEAMGVQTYRYKLQVFTMSAGLAALAGGLYGHYVTFVSPEAFFVNTSIIFVVMAVIGGLQQLWGAIIGTTLVVVLGEWLQQILPQVISGAKGEVQIVFFGLILVGVLALLPQGIASIRLIWTRGGGSA